MEVIPQYKDEPIPTQIDIVYQVLYPILETRRAEIEQTKRRTFKYGETDRHQLDVYYPSTTPTGKAPVLFFIYGGGYHSGDRQMAAPRDLVYANVGAFFARQGLVVVIPDYRILPNMKFPDPAVDVKDAIAWVANHADEINADASVEADVNHLFIAGHSAGAAIVTTTLLLPDFFPADLKQRVRGVILKGGGYHFQTKTPSLPPAAISAYFGSDEDVLRNQPLSLLKNASDDAVQSLPEVTTYVSEYEVPAIRESSIEFYKVLGDRRGKPVPAGVLAGHNHISPHVALCTGQGEEWAVEVASWVKARVPR
ncbi:uncharacterized protein PHACADRAFT_200066 [Phanerochaete carnosa HHB-10118-sp]|uniref:BD-FAE-like domain-containing protein n=1 Tax=Phanerochaete carnosa (strain HHB-10118-sp) TaxID=650164 RepID=K5WLT2_PHACS|nr:uncharacterized protein PHACADRAFT_200066 [Phanerochaete carnosa HHB-10118-sp]EKM51247.1 hypothetical protein PHACADRAFT_200066 [Phanerochaete carnosa HHB-10118-sp]